jgi:hypothetical protein
MRDREVRDKLPERLAMAEGLLKDGTIHKYFPGMGWTSRQAGEFRALTRYADQKTTRRTA